MDTQGYSDRSAASPIAVAIEDAPQAVGVSRTRIFQAIRDKEITARKAGRSTVIEFEELKRWVRSLPARGRPVAA
jgi:excisionase family DNA binding protein